MGGSRSSEEFKVAKKKKSHEDTDSKGKKTVQLYNEYLNEIYYIPIFISCFLYKTLKHFLYIFHWLSEKIAILNITLVIRAYVGHYSEELSWNILT